MRQLTRFEHGLRVDAGCSRESAIEFESRHTGLTARLIGQREKLLLRLEFFVVEGNVGGNRRYGPQRGLLRLAVCRGSHQTNRGLYRSHANHKHKREQQSGEAMHQFVPTKLDPGRDRISRKPFGTQDRTGSTWLLMVG